MPYELSFAKRVPLLDRSQYINDCCIGGDAVVNRLLPAVRAHYNEIQTNQEDWGWFIWCVKGPVKLAIDVFNEDADEGRFLVHLTSRTRPLYLFSAIVDTPELEELRALVESDLDAWIGYDVKTIHLDHKYFPDQTET